MQEIQDSTEATLEAAGLRPTSAGWFQQLLARRLTYSSVISLAVVLAAFHAASMPLRAGTPWLIFLQDDCFYYLKIADNMALGKGSTFNGIVATNGYHPLWLLALACFRFVFHSAPFIVFIAAWVVVSTVATYLLARVLLRRSGASALVTNALAAFVAAFSMQLFYTGMEVILTIPLVLLFLLVCISADLKRHGAKHAFALGLLISLMVLSRIDTALLVGVVGVSFLFHADARSQVTWKQLTGLMLGLSPLILYFASNHIVFNTWLPISGMVKQLKVGHWPAPQAWQTLYSGPIHHPISFIPILFGIALVPWMYRRLSQNEQILFPSVLIWPLLYMFMLSYVSDWHLWMWYFYPLRPALCVALVLLCRWQPAARLARIPAVSVALTLLAVFKLFTARWTEGDMRPMFDIATATRRFALTHPGVYAMGDRSGIVGYTLLQPLVQTEGLVMDRPFLESMRHAPKLRQALAPYHVRFYIATQTAPYAPCFHASEPGQAGPLSPHLNQEFCSPPVAVFDQGDTRTAIYDLQNP